jgi:hypothetical protein
MPGNRIVMGWGISYAPAVTALGAKTAVGGACLSYLLPTHPDSPRRVPSGGRSPRGAIPPRNWKSSLLMIRPEVRSSSCSLRAQPLIRRKPRPGHEGQHRCLSRSGQFGR